MCALGLRGNRNQANCDGRVECQIVRMGDFCLVEAPWINSYPPMTVGKLFKFLLKQKRCAQGTDKNGVVVGVMARVKDQQETGG